MAIISGEGGSEQQQKSAQRQETTPRLTWLKYNRIQIQVFVIFMEQLVEELSEEGGAEVPADDHMTGIPDLLVLATGVDREDGHLIDKLICLLRNKYNRKENDEDGSKSSESTGRTDISVSHSTDRYHSVVHPCMEWERLFMILEVLYDSRI
jgi:hypothetical protein